MARKAGQLIARGPRTWLVRVSLGRDRETGTRKYYNKTVRGSFREAQAYLNRKLQELDPRKSVACCRHPTGPLFGSMARHSSQTAAAAEKLHRLRMSAEASYSSRSRW